MGLGLLLALALLLFSAAHAYHHPGDAADAMPSRPTSPIWNVFGLLVLAGIAYAIWKVYSYQKKMRA